MSEAEKPETIERRLAHGLLPLVGRGLDVGSGPFELPAAYYQGECRPWDVGDGDAHKLEGIEPGSLDWLLASHILEHLEEPARALARWVEVVRPGGVILLSVPHRDLYEGRLQPPSAWNRDHKRFYLPLHSDGSAGVYGFGDFLRAHQHYGFRLDHLEVGDRGCVPSNGYTVHATGEYCIDAVLIVSGGRITSPSRNATHRCAWCPTKGVDACRHSCYDR